MNRHIVSSFAPVTLIGSGVLRNEDLEDALTLGETLIAADGGAAAALRFGRLPDAVIGDLDSLDGETRRQLNEDQVHLIAEQNSTDFDKALRSIDAPVVIAVGFLGGRLDHQLAVLHTLVARAHLPCIVVGETEITCLLPPAIEVPTQMGDVVSLMPFAPVAGTSNGLEWEIEGLAFDPTLFVGTSNLARGPVHLTMETPAMLGMFPRRLLEPLTQALAHAKRWPAP